MKEKKMSIQNERKEKYRHKLKRGDMLRKKVVITLEHKKEREHMMILNQTETHRSFS